MHHLHVAFRSIALICAVVTAGCADLGSSGSTTSADVGASSGDAVAGDTGPAPVTCVKTETTLPAAESCSGKCGAKYDKSLPCQCNDLCAQYGNCCADYGPVCEPSKSTCAGRCGAYDKNAACQCTDDCDKTGTCCEDFLDQCHGSEGFDFTQPDAEEAKLCDKPLNLFNIQYAKDGDSLELIDGSIVRLLLVNTSELTTSDCYSKEALNWMKALVKAHKTVCLVSDPGQPDKDQYGRLLRYVYYKEEAAGGAWVNLNLRLIRLGIGRVFYPFAKGLRWETRGLLTQARARADNEGGWCVCGWQ